MRHIIQAQAPIIAPQPSTGSNQIAPDIKTIVKRVSPVPSKRWSDVASTPGNVA
jgi:hypothetical protein